MTSWEERASSWGVLAATYDGKVKSKEWYDDVKSHIDKNLKEKEKVVKMLSEELNKEQ